MRCRVAGHGGRSGGRRWRRTQRTAGVLVLRQKWCCVAWNAQEIRGGRTCVWGHPGRCVTGWARREDRPAGGRSRLPDLDSPAGLPAPHHKGARSVGEKHFHGKMKRLLYIFCTL